MVINILGISLVKGFIKIFLLMLCCICLVHLVFRKRLSDLEHSVAGQPSTVSLVNSVVKESNVVGSSKADIGKETKESLGFDPKFQVTTISQSFSVSSPHFEPSNKVDFLALMSVFRVDHRD